MNHDVPTPMPLIVAACPHPETRNAGLGFSWTRARLVWPDEDGSPETRSLQIADAVEFWHSVLGSGVEATAPELLTVLEVMRRWPKVTADALHSHGLGYAKSLANAAYRTGDALHEEAKQAFARSEIDIALARFRRAMAELQFSVSSELLSELTRRIATGKYASGAAMSSRWEALSPETLTRALAYSSTSIELGNIQPETVSYRIELLLALFDRSGAPDALEEARRLAREYPALRIGTELAQAEVRLRLVLASSGEPRSTYQRVGIKLLDEFSRADWRRRHASHCCSSPPWCRNRTNSGHPADRCVNSNWTRVSGRRFTIRSSLRRCADRGRSPRRAATANSLRTSRDPRHPAASPPRRGTSQSAVGARL